MNFDSFKDLEKHLKQKIDTALKKDVAPVVKNTMTDNIQSTVYDWEPSVYRRREESGGLLDPDYLVDNVSDNVLTVENIAPKNKSIKYTNKYNNGFKSLSDSQRNGNDRLDGIIVSGIGYDYPGDFARPRDFYKATVVDLESTGKVVDSLKKSLKKQGLDVE